MTTESILRIDVDSADASVKLNRLEVDLGKVTAAGEKAASSAKNAGEGAKSAGAGAEIASSAFDKLSKGLLNATSIIDKALSGFNMLKVVVLGASEAFIKIAEEITKFQAFLSMMSVTTGNIASARKEFNFLLELANRLGVPLEALTKNFGQFSAAVKGSVIEGEKAKYVFESFATMTRALHLSTHDTTLTFYALTQMMSKGVVSMEELRRQLGEKMPGAMNLAARAVNTTMLELEGAIRKGSVDSGKLLLAMSDQILREYGGPAKFAAQALDAEMNKLHNTLKTIVVALYDMGVATAFKEVIQELNRIMSDPAIVKTFADTLKELAGKLAEFLRHIDAKFISETMASFKKAITEGSNALLSMLDVLKQILPHFTEFVKGAFVLAGIKGGASIGAILGGLAPGGMIGKLGGAAVGSAAGGILGGTAAYLAVKDIGSPSYGGSREVSGKIGPPISTNTGPQPPATNAYTLGDVLNTKGKPTDYAMKADLESLKGALQLLEKSLKAKQDMLKIDFQAGKISEDMMLYGQAELETEKQLAVYSEAKKAQDTIKSSAGYLAKPEKYKAEIQKFQNAMDEASQAISTNWELTYNKMDKGHADLTKKINQATANMLGQESSFADQYAQKWENEFGNTLKTLQASLGNIGEYAEPAVKDLIKQLETLKKKYEEVGAAKDLVKGAQIEVNQLKATFAEIDNATQPGLIGGLLKDIQKANALSGVIDDLKEKSATLKKNPMNIFAVGEAAKIDKEIEALIKDTQVNTKALGTTISENLTDGIMAGFEKGKTIAEEFRNTLKNMFKNLVLKPIVQYIMNPIGAAVSGAVNSGLASVFGTSVAGSAAGSAFGGGSLLASAAASGGSFGAFASGVQMAMTEGITTGFTTGMSMIGTSGGFSAGLGAMVPMIGAVVAGIFVLKSLFGKKGGPKTNAGATIIDSTLSYGGPLGSGAGNTGLGESLAKFVPLMNTFITKLGGTADTGMRVSLGSSSDPRGSAPDFTLAQMYSGSGKQIYDRVNTHVGRGGAATELGVEMQRMMLAALQNADLKPWADKIIEGLNPVNMTAEQLTAVFTQLDQALATISEAESVRKTILFSLMSDTEKYTLALKELSDAGMPNTVDGLKVFLNSLDLTTESGQKAFGTFIGLQGSFEFVQQYVPPVTASLTDLGTAAGNTVTTLRSAVSIEAERSSLQNQYNQLTMTSTELRDAERLTIVTANQDLFDSITVKLAAKKLADDQLVTDRAAEEVARTKLGWDQQLLVLQGKSTQKEIDRANTLASTADQASKDVMNLVFAAQDLADTNAAAAVETQKLADAEKEMLAIRQSWQEKYNVLSGKITQTEQDRAALLTSTTDISTQNLMKMVWVLEDLQVITDQVAETNRLEAERLKAINSERLGLENQLLQVYGNTAELRKRELATLDPSNQTLQQLIWTTEDTIKAEQALITVRQQAVNEAMQAVSDALATVQRSVQAERDTITLAYNKSIKSVSDSMAAVNRAVQGEKDRITSTYNNSVQSVSSAITAITDSVSKLTDLASALKGTLRSIGASDVSRVVAQGTITSALALAKSSGALPTAESLAPALKSIAKPSEELFTNFTDYQRDFVKTANNILELSGIADSQLTLAKQSETSQKELLDSMRVAYDAELLRLDNISLSAQRQVDAVNGVDNSILSTGDASRALSASIALVDKAFYDSEMLRLDGVLTNAQNQVNILNKVDTSVLTVNQSVLNLSATITTAMTAQASLVAAQTTASQAAINRATMQSPEYTSPAPTIAAAGKVGLNSSDSVIMNAAKVMYNSTQGGIATSIYNAAAASVGIDLVNDPLGYSKFSNLIGYNGDPESLRVKYGFDTGINQVPFDMTANIHQGERVMPAADNRELMERLRDPKENSKVLADAVRALKTDLAGIRSSVAAQESFWRTLSPAGNSINVTIAPEEFE